MNFKDSTRPQKIRNPILSSIIIGSSKHKTLLFIIDSLVHIFTFPKLLRRKTFHRHDKHKQLVSTPSWAINIPLRRLTRSARLGQAMYPSRRMDPTKTRKTRRNFPRAPPRRSSRHGHHQKVRVSQGKPPDLPRLGSRPRMSET